MIRDFVVGMMWTAAILVAVITIAALFIGVIYVLLWAGVPVPMNVIIPSITILLCTGGFIHMNEKRRWS